MQSPEHWDSQPAYICCLREPSAPFNVRFNAYPSWARLACTAYWKSHCSGALLNDLPAADRIGPIVGLHLENQCLLLVEDETLVALLVEDMLTKLGCRNVLHAAGVPEALTLLRMRQPDAAILDVNLRNVLVYPVAEHLVAARVPFVFATGYGSGGLANRWKDMPVIQKPIERPALVAALRSMLRP